jgi:hypothetical protein
MDQFAALKQLRESAAITAPVPTPSTTIRIT